MNSRLALLMIFFSLTSSPSYSMFKLITDYLNGTDAAVQDIIKTRASKIALAQALDKQECICQSSAYTYGEVSYTLHVIKMRNSDEIKTVITCNKKEVLDKVSALIDQEEESEQA